MSLTTRPTSPTAPPEARVPDVPIYRLSVAQYRAMAEAGILSEDDPVELLDGWLVPKMTKLPPHTLASGLLQDALTTVLPKGWFLKVQDRIETLDSAPEPDLAIVRGTRRDFAGRHPGAQDLGLVVEVADSSLSQDPGLKKQIYAGAGIPIYWIVNLVDRRVEVYTDPTGPIDDPDYRHQRHYTSRESVPLVLDGALVGALSVEELLP